MSGFADITSLARANVTEASTQFPFSSTLSAPVGVVPSTAPAVLMAQSVASPPSPVQLQALGTGPNFAIQYQPNVTGQVEGSDAFLRQLSPFMIRLEPPLVYGITSMGGSPPGQIAVNALTTALTSSAQFSSARSTLARSGLGTGPANAQTPQAYLLTAGQQQPPAGNPNQQQQPTAFTPAIADFLTALDQARQLNAILNTPPLVLLINPQSMKIDYTKLQQYQERTRFGYMFNAWGEEQPKISIAAKCGAFYSGTRGVAYASKQDSVAWQNLMSAFTIYQNNGYIYDTIGKSNAHQFVGALSIHYDQFIYYGNMESFSWTYDEKNQLGGIEFSMSFVVNAMVDTEQAPLTSPIPNPGDSPGVYSVGIDFANGLTLSTQGRPVSPGGALGTLIPGSIAPLVTGTGVAAPSIGPGNLGFQPAGSPTQPGQRTVFVSAPQSVTPYGDI
jgi:hypothetical protein